MTKSKTNNGIKNISFELNNINKSHIATKTNDISNISSIKPKNSKNLYNNKSNNNITKNKKMKNMKKIYNINGKSPEDNLQKNYQHSRDDVNIQNNFIKETNNYKFNNYMFRTLKKEGSRVIVLKNNYIHLTEKKLQKEPLDRKVNLSSKIIQFPKLNNKQIKKNERKKIKIDVNAISNKINDRVYIRNDSEFYKNDYPKKYLNYNNKTTINYKTKREIEPLDSYRDKIYTTKSKKVQKKIYFDKYK